MRISGRFLILPLKLPALAVFFFPFFADAAGTGRHSPPVETLANILSLVIIIVVAKLGILAMLTVVQLLRPAAVRAARVPLRATPVRVFFVGLFTMVGAILLLGIARGLSGPLGAGLALAVLSVLVWWILNGLAAVFSELGERFQAEIGGLRVGSETAALLVGGVLLLTAGFLPAVGQIAQIAALLCAVGIAVTQRIDRTIARMHGKKSKPESDDVPPGDVGSAGKDAPAA